MASTIKDIIKNDASGIIGRAFAFAEKAHRGQKRKSGEPYIIHPTAVAEILAGWKLDAGTIAAGLLHDTVEDTTATLDDIKREFGDEIAFLVNGVTKLGRVKYRGARPTEGYLSSRAAGNGSETRSDDAGVPAEVRQGGATKSQPRSQTRSRKNILSQASERAENMRKLMLSLSQDLRVVFVKLADRLHNMRTLAALPPLKQKRIALETDEIYAPLAYRLGMQNISGELQDLAFPYLHPKEFDWLRKTANARYETRLKYLERLKPEVEKLLEQHGIKPISIDFRAKRYSSLYKKLLRYDMDLGKVYDLVAMRFIMETIPECYAALGVIHSAWPPVPGKIKDYIALPKPNSYRSLHTTIIGPEEQIVEFQIRTKTMHEENETGVAAHWIYKMQSSGQKAKDITKEIAWVQQLREWQEHISSSPSRGREGGGSDSKASSEFLESMKVDFFRDRIFAITPQGEVVDLPIYSTPIDFAYRIHSDIGDSAIGAKVNGTIVPLDHKLQSGDMVEIITQKGKRPSEDWLGFVASAAARDHIRNTLRKKNSLTKNINAPTRAELKIAVEDRLGLIKELSATINRSHLNILSFHTDNPKSGKYPIDKIEINTADRAKIEKLILKLKSIKGVKEISYKLI